MTFNAPSNPKTFKDLATLKRRRIRSFFEPINPFYLSIGECHEMKVSFWCTLLKTNYRQNYPPFSTIMGSCIFLKLNDFYFHVDYIYVSTCIGGATPCAFTLLTFCPRVDLKLIAFCLIWNLSIFTKISNVPKNNTGSQK